MIANEHDDTFTPFTLTADGRCVIAPEDEWARIEAAATAGRRIAIGDVFAEWDVVFLRSRLFSMIDRTAATWCIETRHPENVERMMPQYFAPIPEPCRNLDHFLDSSPECPACRGSKCQTFRPNVHLYAGPLYTQADADAMVPALLRCPAAMRGLVITPREGIRLSPYAADGRVKVTQGIDCDHVVIRGDDKPMHPAHVRGIIAQCKAAGVPVWFDGWGEWCLNEHKTYGKIFGSAGSLSGPWVTACSTDRNSIGDQKYHAYPANVDDEFGEYETLSRVGRARSGAMLDGKEWRQLPEVKG
jgi:hypothetical protein